MRSDRNLNDLQLSQRPRAPTQGTWSQLPWAKKPSSSELEECPLKPKLNHQGGSLEPGHVGQ